MLKRLLLAPVAVLCCLSAQAQFRYTFKDTTTAYTPLVGATSLTSSLIWDEEILSAPMPFTWKIDSSLSVNRFNLALEIPGILADTTNFGNLDGFILSDVDIADRGTLTGTAPLSPIRYLTTGSTPNRIFKVEIANAGLFAEYGLYNTMNDSFSMQIWVYETKNIVEFHYGPSRITNPSDYFNVNSAGPLVGYGKHLDFVGGTMGSLYFLKGNAASPAIDTFTLPSTSSPTVALNSWPANGKVYRFTPKAFCVTPTASFTSSSPVGKTLQYTFTGSTTGIDSLVWNFGDGLKQKVTSAFTTPISHTFSVNGHYSVTLTVYNSCGSSTFTKQLALSIGNLSTLGDVQIYPNPAGNYLVVEGLQAGDKASILSIVGKEVISSDIISNKQTLDISTLPAGSYMLLLSNAKGITGTTKIIKR